MKPGDQFIKVSTDYISLEGVKRPVDFEAILALPEVATAFACGARDLCAIVLRAGKAPSAELRAHIEALLEASGGTVRNNTCI